MKELIIIAGANGSGKTTFSKPLIAETTYAFLNADEIERELDTPDTAGSKLKAGRLFFQRMYELTNARESFILESTLAGKYLVKVIETVKNKGYSVSIVYVFLENPQICLERISARVKDGGHDIPKEDVIRRYYRSKKNFWLLYKNLANDWLLYFNGLQTIQQVAAGKGEIYEVEHELLFEKYLKDVKI